MFPTQIMNSVVKEKKIRLGRSQAVFLIDISRVPTLFSAGAELRVGKNRKSSPQSGSGKKHGVN